MNKCLLIFIIQGLLPHQHPQNINLCTGTPLTASSLSTIPATFSQRTIPTRMIHNIKDKEYALTMTGTSVKYPKT